jgi:hypothetical protein
MHGSHSISGTIDANHQTDRHLGGFVATTPNTYRAMGFGDHLV